MSDGITDKQTDLGDYVTFVVGLRQQGIRTLHAVALHYQCYDMAAVIRYESRCHVYTL